MAVNKTSGRTADRKRLNMSEPYEIAYARSDRASPERKAMLAKAEAERAGRGSGSGATAKRSAKAAAKKTSGSSAHKSAASKARKSPASGARKTSSARTSSSPAMKRTNAASAQPRAPTQRGTPHPPKVEKTVENTAPKTMREPDAIDLLTDDHLAVTALFRRYERLARRGAGADERRALAGQICAIRSLAVTCSTFASSSMSASMPAPRAAG